MSHKKDSITSQSIRVIALVIAMLSMSACTDARPNARILSQAPAAAPAAYKQGWRDGCESGMAITGNSLYKAVYQNKIDPERVNDTQYFRGWNEAKVYCAHYTMAVQWEAGTLPKTPTEETLVPEAPKNIFSIAASWGATTLFKGNENGEEEEPEQEGFGGFAYNN